MASVAVAVCSCTGMSEETSVVNEEMVVLDFDVPCQKLSRLSGTVEEDVVEDLQIFVFGMDGQLNAYGHSESDELTLTCSTGEKRVAALVNAPIVGSVTTETALKDLVSAFSDNIVTGKSDGSFGIGEHISRQDMAVMVCRACNRTMPVSTADFADNDAISDYARESVAKLSAAGIINGMPDGSFAPTESTTRSQAAKMIYTIMEKGGIK